MRRDGLPLLEGEGWGEVWSIFGKLTHLTLSLSFQERGPARPATCANAVEMRGRVGTIMAMALPSFHRD